MSSSTLILSPRIQTDVTASSFSLRIDHSEVDPMEDLRLSPEMDEDLIPSPTSPDDLILAHPTTDEDQESPDGKDDLRQVLLNRY